MKTSGMQKVNNGLYLQNWSCFNLLAAHQTLSTKRCLLNKKGNGQSNKRFQLVCGIFLSYEAKESRSSAGKSMDYKEINLVLIPKIKRKVHISSVDKYLPFLNGVALNPADIKSLFIVFLSRNF